MAWILVNQCDRIYMIDLPQNIPIADYNELPRDLTASLERPGAADVKEMLRRVIWGTEGGLRYSDLDHDFARIPDAISLVVRRGNLAIGHYCSVPRSWGFLQVLLAVDPFYKRKGLGRWLVQEGKRLFTPHLEPDQVLAGTIEADNTDSLQLSESVGYQRVGCIEIVSFSRRKPRAWSQVSRLQPNDFNRVMETLQGYGASWNDTTHSVRAEECFVWYDGMHIRAGVQAVLKNYRIHSLGGKFGKILVKLMPIYGENASDYRFASLHFPWGDTHLFNRLFESVLANLGVSSAVIGYDREDKTLHHALTRLNRGALGALARRQIFWVTATGPLTRPIAFTATNVV